MMSKQKSFGISVLVVLFMASGVFAANVTPDVIFGSGNANGSFTVDQSGGVELGLRGKLRHNAAGSPENTFNYDGVHTYTFMPGVAPTQAFPTAEWSFEWSVNSDWDGSSGYKLDDLTYALSMTSSTGTFFAAFDPINANLADHAIGNNSTGNGAGAVAGDATAYANLIAANNVAQNSWKPHWFVAGFNPNAGGTYDFVLEAFDTGGSSVARTAMTINVVPLPAAVWGGMMLLGALGIRRKLNS